jgi:hypothetical protein
MWLLRMVGWKVLLELVDDNVDQQMWLVAYPSRGTAFGKEVYIKRILSIESIR